MSIVVKAGIRNGSKNNVVEANVQKAWNANHHLVDSAGRRVGSVKVEKCSSSTGTVASASGHVTTPIPGYSVKPVPIVQFREPSPPRYSGNSRPFVQPYNSGPYETIELCIYDEDSGNIYTIKAKPQTMIEHLRLKIERKCDVEVDSQILFFGDKVLDDGERLEDYDIEHDSEITLKTRLSCRMSFPISLHTEYDSREIFVTRTWRVWYLKKRICRWFGLDPDCVTLNHAGLCMDEDGFSLGDYYVTENSVIIID